MVRLQLLGPVDLRDESGRELRQLLGQPKRLALLAYLAGNAPEHFHRRDRILALFWPESTEDQARHGLRQVLYELRNRLGEAVIVRRGADEIAVNNDVVACDVEQFFSALSENDFDCATELYRGDFMSGFFVSNAPELEKWIENRRTELHRRITGVWWKLAAKREQANDMSGAVAAADRAVALSPADEAGVRTLLSLLSRHRNIGEAVRVYDRLQRHLADEFGVEPSAETTALISQIRKNVSDRESAPTHDNQANVATVVNDLTPIPAAPAPNEIETTTERSMSTTMSPSGWTHPTVVATGFGVASLAVLGAVYLLVLQLGLPYWVLWTAVVLLLLGVPIIGATARVERRRMPRPGQPRPAPHPWLNWGRTWQGGGLALANLGVVAATFMAMRSLGIGPAATLISKGVLETRDAILVAEFENRTQDATLAATITSGLRIDLSQSTAMRLVEPASITAALERMMVHPDARLDEALARQIAEREGIKAVLAGDVSSVGTGYMLSARLIAPVDGALLGAERVSADSDAELIAAIDRLSARLRALIGESLKDVRASPPLHRVTTSSLDALRKFTEANRLANVLGDWEGARLLLEDAVALDTTFAMAYRKLAFTGPPGGQRTDAGQAALTRAFELREHLPASERHHIEADYYAVVDYDEQKARAAYRATLAIDSNNYMALNNLAARMIHTRQWAEQESLAIRAIDEGGIWQAYINLISAQLLQGKIDDARATLDRFARANPGSPFIVTWELNMLRASRRYDEAETVLRQRLADPDVAGDVRRDAMEDLGDLLWLRGRVGEAERWYGNWMAEENGPNRFPAAYHLATLLATLARSDEATRLMEGFPVDTGPRLERPYLGLAEFHASAGRLAQAKRLLARHDSVIPAGFLKHPFRQQYVHQIAGEVALVEGRLGDAINEFRATNELAGACVTCGLARMGYAFAQNGQSDSALSVYRRLVSTPTDGLLYDDDVRWLPGAYKRLGELFEARGDTVNAVMYYDEFVKLWKDADPVLQPQVDDVRRHIANLGGGKRETADGRLETGPAGLDK